MIKKYWVLAVFFLAVVGHAVAWAETELKIITLQHRFPQEILPSVQALVGADGSVSTTQNFLIVRASPENMKQIEQLVAGLDTEQKNIRITVSHDSQVISRQRGAGVSGSLQVGDVQLQKQNQGQLVRPSSRQYQPQGVEIDISQSELASSQSGQEFVTVLDGQRAFIRVGQSVPYTQQWVNFSQRYPSAYSSIGTTQFRDITTGFAVRPRYIGQQVVVEITPRIASLSAGGYIDFEELSTVVRVVPGTWLDIGGIMQSKDDVSRAILSGYQDSDQRHNGLLIMVE